MDEVPEFKKALAKQSREDSGSGGASSAPEARGAELYVIGKVECQLEVSAAQPASQ
jgi:hypothetical protein